ncbi:MAG: hypothetical protein INH37_05345, partial [Myxococcaceae bacterium]|nr:hypothetical protein [Myxococcaceae bacterium]
MAPLLLAVALAATPGSIAPRTVDVGDVLLVMGEAGFAAGGGRPWLDRASDLSAVTPLFQRFELVVSEVPLLGPASVMVLELQQRADGWQARVALSAA